jgi:hypothetical protein
MRFWVHIAQIMAFVAGLAALFAANADGRQDLAFLTASGKSLDLASLRGKVVVLLFSGVQDPQCRDEIKALGTLVERYTAKEVSIYWVSINPESAVSNEELKAPCGPSGSVNVLRDPAQAGFRRFAASPPQIPTLVILDQKGQVSLRPRGGFNPNADFVNNLAATIDKLLAQTASTAFPIPTFQTLPTVISVSPPVEPTSSSARDDGLRATCNKPQIRRRPAGSS